MIEYVASIKAIMMLLVVLGHSCIIYTGWWSAFPPAETSAFFAFLTKWFNTFHTYCFVFVSGALYYHLRYRTTKYRNTIQVIQKKVKRLICPYFLTSVIWALPVRYMIIGGDIREIITGYILGKNADQLWFLLMLFWTFVLSCCIFERIDISCCSRRKAMLLILGGYMLYGIAVVLNAANVPGYFQWISALTYELFFIMGALFERVYLNCTKAIIRNRNSNIYIYIYITVRNYKYWRYLDN